ncbi:MAG: GntR family transcriptional regulator [Victivallales bacterium]|nr:GntR family transcriptional regulator [Victivallales bacterium]
MIESKYIALAEDIGSRVKSGEFTGALPGVHRMAREYGVNFMTVNKAVNRLVSEGLLYRVSRVGTYPKFSSRLGFVHFGDAESSRVPLSGVYLGLLEGIESAASARDLSISIKNCESSSRDAAKFFPGGIDGVIHLGIPLSDSVVCWLKGLPSVKVMGQSDPAYGGSQVTYDNKVVGELAAGYLLGVGCHNVGVLGFSSRAGIYRERSEEFARKISESGCRVGSFAMQDDSSHHSRVKGICEAVAALASAPERYDGLFAVGVWMLPLVYGELRRHGLEPGGDIRVVVCDWCSSSLVGVSPLPAVIDIRVEDIGRRAVEALLEDISCQPALRGKSLVELPPILLDPEGVSKALNKLVAA